MIKVGTQWWNGIRGTLSLSEVVFVVSGEMFIHGGYVINPGPLCGGIFGVPIV